MGTKKKTIQEEINRYGREILASKAFARAAGQIHHRRATVASHTLNVAHASLFLCHLLERLHIPTDKRRVTVGALCHDLGILDRAEKYASAKQCCFRHPADSVTVARHLVPNLDTGTENVIRSHMWPLSPYAPENREALIVSLADKYAAVKDTIPWLRPNNPFLSSD